MTKIQTFAAALGNSNAGASEDSRLSFRSLTARKLTRDAALGAAVSPAEFVTGFDIQWRGPVEQMVMHKRGGSTAPRV